MRCHIAVKALPGTEMVEKTGKKIGKDNHDQMVRRGVCSICGGDVRRFCATGKDTNAVANTDSARLHSRPPKDQKPNMTKTTQKNEMAKRRFYEYLRGPERCSAKSVENYEKAIWRWEDFSDYADFSDFNQTKAVAFREWLATMKKAGSENNLSISYCYDVLRFLKRFFGWLVKQPGYKHINETAVDYLNSSRAETRIVNQSRGVVFPSVEEIKGVIESIQGTSEVDMRDKALLSLVFLIGARNTATRTLRMKCFDRERWIVYQDRALGVETKHSKRIVSVLLPLSYKEPIPYFLAWFDYLRDAKGFKPDDPIFPATKVENGLNNNLSYRNTGTVKPILWKSPVAIQKIFKNRFEQAKVRYYHPHTFRHSLAKEASKLPLTEEQKKAFSQSLGHKNVAMTFGYYGQSPLSEDKQIEILKSINFERLNAPTGQQLLSPEEMELFVKLCDKIRGVSQEPKSHV